MNPTCPQCDSIEESEIILPSLYPLDTKRESAEEKARIKTLTLGVVIPDITFELDLDNKPMYLFSSYDIEKFYGVQVPSGDSPEAL